MTSVNNQFAQLTSVATILGIMFGVLMIWPGIIALLLGVLLPLRSCSAEQETGVLSWTKVGTASFVFAS